MGRRMGRMGTTLLCTPLQPPAPPPPPPSRADAPAWVWCSSASMRYVLWARIRHLIYICIVHTHTHTYTGVFVQHLCAQARAGLTGRHERQDRRQRQAHQVDVVTGDCAASHPLLLEMHQLLLDTPALLRGGGYMSTTCVYNVCLQRVSTTCVYNVCLQRVSTTCVYNVCLQRVSTTCVVGQHCVDVSICRIVFSLSHVCGLLPLSCMCHRLSLSLSLSRARSLSLLLSRMSCSLSAERPPIYVHFA
jgi:hypothetical protein